MKNRIILFFGIIVSILFALFLSNYLSNKKFIKNYKKEIYELSDGDIMSFTSPSVAPFNRGDIFYKKGMLPEAEEEFKNALKKSHSEEKDCSIRINLALSIAMDIDKDKVTIDNLDETIARLEEAKGYLLENGCAHDEDEDGHDKDAQQLKDDIDKFIEELKKQPEQQNGQGQNSNSQQEQKPEDKQEQDNQKNDDKGNEGDNNSDDLEKKSEEEKAKEQIDELQRRSDEQRRKESVPDDSDPGYGSGLQDKVW